MQPAWYNINVNIYWPILASLSKIDTLKKSSFLEKLLFRQILSLNVITNLNKTQLK